MEMRQGQRRFPIFSVVKVLIAAYLVTMVILLVLAGLLYKLELSEPVVDGGIMTNVRSEVLDDASKPIPGLYAVGLDGAMLWRNVYTQNMPGTAMANNINSGRNAANAAAKYIA